MNITLFPVSLPFVLDDDDKVVHFKGLIAVTYLVAAIPGLMPHNVCFYET